MRVAHTGSAAGQGDRKERGTLVRSVRGRKRLWQPGVPRGRQSGRQESGHRTTHRQGTASYDTHSHSRNFLDCIKTRAECRADILVGHISTSSTIIGNIAHKTRSMLEWDGRAERFPGNSRANELLHYKYRAPYKLG